MSRGYLPFLSFPSSISQGVICGYSSSPEWSDSGYSSSPEWSESDHSGDDEYPLGAGIFLGLFLVVVVKAVVTRNKPK